MVWTTLVILDRRAAFQQHPRVSNLAPSGIKKGNRLRTQSDENHGFDVANVSTWCFYELRTFWLRNFALVQSTDDSLALRMGPHAAETKLPVLMHHPLRIFL